MSYRFVREHAKQFPVTALCHVMQVAKSGYYVDASGSYRIADEAPWWDMFWRQNEYYDQAIARVAEPPRIKPSALAFGGCLALHRDMYCNVSFDPWSVRGEDIDYVINARMHGADVFLF